MASVDPATPFEFMIGTGSKTLQFFYQNPNEDVKIGFPPVRVETDEEVNCVVALVAEKAEDFNRRNNLKKSKAPVQYYSSAVRARSLLQPDVVRYNLRSYAYCTPGVSQTGLSIKIFAMEPTLN